MEIRNYVEKLSIKLQSQNLASSTIETYCSCVTVFLAHFSKTHKEPKAITDDEIEKYFLTLNSYNYRKQMINAVRHFYRDVMGQKKKLEKIPYGKNKKTLPEVLTRHEVQSLINCIENIKHKTIIALIYACGLRISECTEAEIINFNSKECTLWVRGGKGGKDRLLSIPENVMHLIIKYYWQYKPVKFMFEGEPGAMYSESSIRSIFHAAVHKTGIKRKLKVHSLRHSFATHHIENGTSDSVLMELMGHNSVKTVQIYKHLNKKFISSYPSPAANLNL